MPSTIQRTRSRYSVSEPTRSVAKSAR